MATTKRRTTRRKSVAPAAPARRKRRAPARPTTRRRSAPRKKGLLSEMFNPAMAQAGFRTTVSGAMGGVVGALADKFIPAPDPSVAALYKIAGGFAFATMGKLPNVGAGLAAVGVYQLIQNSGMLNDDADYADDLELLPVVMNDNGSGYLEDAGYGYLSDDVVLQDGDPGFSVLNYDEY